MTAKKKRRRRAPAGTSRASQPTPSREASDGGRERQPFLSSLLRGPGTGAQYPGAMVSLARGAAAVGSSPVVLAACFLSILAAWLGLLALGMEGSPGRLVDLFAIPPISTYYDLGNGVGLYGLGRGLLVFQP